MEGLLGHRRPRRVRVAWHEVDVEAGQDLGQEAVELLAGLGRVRRRVVAVSLLQVDVSLLHRREGGGRTGFLTSVSRSGSAKPLPAMTTRAILRDSFLSSSPPPSPVRYSAKSCARTSALPCDPWRSRPDTRATQPSSS